MNNKKNRRKTGIVYLVGAGPGDPDLISVKGARLLTLCDVVVYDSLVPYELIVTLPANVQREYVGKKPGEHLRSQTEINELMVNLAREGKVVVRLKGGDPFVFGRGAEEADFLWEHGISFEIIPGITAGTAVPEYAGIPCTDRRVASFVLFLSGHKAAEKSLSSVPWEWVGKATQGTLVVYMGVAEIENIVTKLLDAGMSRDTPAAAVERGTFPTQRTLTGHLSRLPEIVRENALQPPVVFIIGEAVNLRETLQWLDEKPLIGVRVMVTRPSDQARELYKNLRNLGAEVLPFPTIATREEFDSTAWGKLSEIKEKHRWLVFTSENGVRYFMKQLHMAYADIRHLADYSIAAVGEGTRRALEDFLISTDFIPTQATTLTLAQQMADKLELEGATVVRVRGNLADDRVERTLVQAGAKVFPMKVYHTFTPAWSEETKDKLFASLPDVIIFTSGSTADGLVEVLSRSELKKLTAGATIVSIGPSTTNTIKSHGLEVDIEAKKHTIPTIVEELLAHHKARPIRRLK
jgi:uroporphyrinogen III methyltransferase/synthase